LKDFYLSVIAGLFSGLCMGIFFSLTIDISFNRWIDPTKLGEFFATVVDVLLILFLLLTFYVVGQLIVKFLLRDKKRHLSFHLNFIAGIYSSTMTFLLVLYYDAPMMRNTITSIGVVLFFVLAYFTVKRKWPK